MALAEKVTSPLAYLQAQTRWRPIEIVFWLATLLPSCCFRIISRSPVRSPLAALFTLSLDLILGYAGIVSLGHAAYFGVGAYTAGLVSKHGWGEPLTGLAMAALAAGIVGYATSFVICRFRHLALIMLTTGFGLLLAELANSLGWLTGGMDGLQGIHTWKLLGYFRFDLYGYTAYSYALAVLFVLFLFARRLIHSPFGLSLRGIRENYVRMPAIGAPRQAHLRTIYTIAACIAGVAGALLGADHRNRVAGFARLRALGRSGRHARARRRREALWRTGRRHYLHGRPRPVFRHRTAILVFLDRHSAGGRGDVSSQRHSRRPGEAVVALEPVVSLPALATRGLAKSFGSLVVASDIEIELPQGVRYALIGPNGAGKTTLINLMTGMLRPDAGRILLDDADITALAPDQRVRRGLVRTYQINSLFPHLTALELVTLAVCERSRAARTWWRQLPAYSHEIDEAYGILSALNLDAVCNRATRELAYGQQRLLEIALALATRPKVLLLDEPAAGVPREESKELFAAIAGLSRDITVLFIEHDMELVFRFASRIIVMVGGRVLVEGSPQEIASDPRVRAVYLGKALDKTPARVES